MREAREEAQLTRKEFASLAHIAEATLRNLETGRHECTLSSRRKVVEHFARLHIAPPAPVAAPEAPAIWSWPTDSLHRPYALEVATRLLRGCRSAARVSA